MIPPSVLALPHHVGVDPGATMGFALIAGDYKMVRPTIRFAEVVKNLEELESIGKDVVADTEQAARVDWWVEDWRFARAEARSRQRSWVSLGRSQGSVEMLAWQGHCATVNYLPVSTTKEKGVLPGWATTLGVATAKHGDGQHRVTEAAMHVAGPVLDILQDLPKTKRPDVAEAILIAAAGWRLRRLEVLDGLAKASGRRSA